MIDWVFAWWWVLLIESLVAAGVVALIALNAHRIVGDAPRSLASLRASMAITALAIFLAYVALMVGVVKFMEGYAGYTAGSTLVVWAAVLALLIMAFQWLLSPYIINALYRARPPSSLEEESLQRELERLARASGVKTPKLVISDLSMPNAFAYGSPLAGSYVAVTRGLLSMMPKREVIAVLGHEVGHLKHRDVSWILALSLVPLAVYFLGRILILSGLFGNGASRRGGGYLLLIALGAALLVASMIFRFLVAHFNRLREYYADAHGALVTGDPRGLQRALARIHSAFAANRWLAEEARQNSYLTALFIVAPLVEASGGFFYDIDYVVEELKRREPSPVEEVFSTHPPIPKRLRFLDRIAARMEA